MRGIMDGQVGLFDRDTLCGKTCPEHSAQTKAKTSKPSSRKSSESSSRKLPTFHCLIRVGGQSQTPSLERQTTERPFPWPTDYTTRSFGECPSAENASRLSQILEACPHPKYSLSAKACQGILNRAKRRGKQLPPELEAALIRQSVCKETELTEAIPPDATVQDGAGGGVTPLTPSTAQPCTMETPRTLKIRSECAGGGKGPLIQENLSATLNCNNDQTLFAQTPTTAAAVDCRNGTENECVNGTLQAKGNGGSSLNLNNVVRVKR